MLWLIPIAAFFVYSLYLGRNTVRSCENAAKAQINDAYIEFLLSEFREQEESAERKRRERESAGESDVREGHRRYLEQEMERWRERESAEHFFL
jgi:hypothetical protein